MRRLGWLGILWPLLAVPFLHDPTPARGTADGTTAADTTYGDDRYVALVPGVEDTLTHGSDTLFRFVPDPDSLGSAVAYRAVRKPGGDSFLVISYDTLTVAALDSAAVDSIWSAWGLGTPYAYAVEVPNNPTQTDTGGALNAAQPRFVENFQTYDNTDSFRANITDKFFLVRADSVMEIDTTVSIGSGWSQSLKITIPGVDSLTSCTGYSAGFYGSGTTVFGSGTKDAWIELWQLWPSGFLMASDYGGCSSGIDFKHLRISAGSGIYFATNKDRNVTRFGNSWTGSWPGPASDNVMDGGGLVPKKDTLYADSVLVPADLNDGVWHRLRYHVKFSSDTLTADGVYRLLIDDTEICVYQYAETYGECLAGIITYDPAKNGTSLGELQLFVPTNQATSYPQSYWFQSIKVWTDDPGWGI